MEPQCFFALSPEKISVALPSIRNAIVISRVKGASGPRKGQKSTSSQLVVTN